MEPLIHIEQPNENFSLGVTQKGGFLKRKKKQILFGLGVVALSLIFYFLFSPPLEFPEGKVIKIEKGSSLQSVSASFKRQEVIRSRVAFEFFVILFGKEKRIVSADYSFEKPLPVYEIARRIGGGVHRTAPVSVTIPEGFDVVQIGETFDLELSNFDKEKFLAKAKDMEGYLFPDTYFFLTNADQESVLQSMSSNFNKKISELEQEIKSSGKTKEEVIIMASIVEREAKGNNDRGIIAGILWKRISIGMPLQADAAPETYKTKGLPEKPIANPGLSAIKAAISPENSPYLYYLHDKEGNIHYARNFSEHRRNIIQYLK